MVVSTSASDCDVSSLLDCSFPASSSQILEIRITQYHSSNCDLNLSSLLDIDVMFLADVLEV